LDYEIRAPDGTIITPKDNNNGKKACWRWSSDKLSWGLKNDYVVIKKDSSGTWTVYSKQYLNADNSGNIVQRQQRPFGIIEDFSSTQASKLLDTLGLQTYFDYAKPAGLMKYLIGLISDDNTDIILDFFAGSGTTAQAVEELNVEDGGSRRWILVQLPEETDEKSEARKAGYNTISDIALERIRRAGAKIDKGDVGFRVFETAGCSFKKWQGYPEDADKLRTDLLDHIEPLVENASNEDLLAELLLKSGVSPMDKIINKGDYFIAPGGLIICLSRTITPEIFSAMIAEKPAKIILHDLAFQTDSQLKANLLLSAERKEISVGVV
jgi:adenine-specific DNA-methyltransferase